MLDHECPLQITSLALNGIPSRNEVYFILFEMLVRHCAVITCLVYTEYRMGCKCCMMCCHNGRPVKLQTVNVPAVINEKKVFLLNVLHTGNKLLLSSLHCDLA